MKSRTLTSITAMTLFAAMAISVRLSAQVTSSSLGQFSPTFVGPAATGCTSAGCSLLTGPFFTPSTASFSFTESAIASPLTGSAIRLAAQDMPLPS